MAPGVNSISARCFISTNASGNWNASYSWTADALNWGETQGVKVSNNSNGYGGTSAAIATAYTNTKANGMVHFSSAGNDGIGSMGYPANLSNVNGIAASDRNGNRASFSQYGPGLAFTAPGADIRLPDRTGAPGYNGSDVASMYGTSFASPYTAGVAALILSVDPNLTAAAVETILQQSCVDMGTAGYDTGYGWGHVNAKAAVDLATTDDNYEPNNSLNEAFDFTQERTWLSAIDGPGRQYDDDWYEIFVDTDSLRVVVNLQFTDADGDIDLRLVNANGTTLDASTSFSDNESIDFVVPAGGTYYLKVDLADEGNEYDLWWDGMPTPFLNLTDSSDDFLNPASSHSFNINSNVAWTWSKPGGATWISSSEASSQSNNQTFNYSVSQNNSIAPRSAVITFSNNFGQSVTHSVNQLGVPPAAPTSLSVSRQTGESIDLLWDASPNATAYEVWRGSAEDPNTMTKLADTSTTSFSDLGIATGDRYFYAVLAKSSNGSGDYSGSEQGILYGRPDSIVKDKRLRGNNRYISYSGQTATIKTKNASQKKFYLYLENDSSSGSEIFNVRSKKGNANFKVVYYSVTNRRNVTALITRGRLNTIVFVGSPEKIEVKVKPGSRQRTKRGKIQLTSLTRFLNYPASYDRGKLILNKTK